MCACITYTSFAAHTGCIGVLDMSVILMLLLLMAGDVELNPGPGKCEYICFAGSCVNVVLTATHFFTVKTQETHETSLSTDPDTDKNRAIVHDVFLRHYSDLVHVMAHIHPAIVALRLFSMELLSADDKNRIMTDIGITKSERSEIIMNVLEARIRIHPSPYQLMERFCMVIRITDNDNVSRDLVTTIMKALGELVNVTLQGIICIVCAVSKSVLLIYLFYQLSDSYNAFLFVIHFTNTSQFIC